MSKNVAVFVDVANIFYAAKAAGVDIDYVTLLKSATAGRDFVRAYAYTGLDPENENQRQFHAFLSRSGYKVVSKDIRKYGDGRIKANLDIELVVDLMRMATHIDIAVVISGDGDFAPAIRAVQQLGVRCEVISFRGNTSSDLIDVADVFTDISQIARVEKGVRSGRRVAAEDDLSMTEVPEKETDLGPRRRRGGRRDERPVARAAAPLAPAAASEGGLPGNIIVLPGERLSRAPEVEEEPDLDLETPAEPAVAGDDANTEESRRRRRRRGGRGRGRGRRPEGEIVQGEVIAGEIMPIEEDELLEEELAPLPQHSTFGSVWDSQIGVPTTPAAATPYDEDADEDEPEIPEYLLAERRAQGRNNNRGRRNDRPGRAGGGYQTAIDRERYGRGGTSAFGGGNRAPDRIQERPRGGQTSHGGQGGGRGQGRPQQPPRMPRPAMNEPRREQERPAASAEPWSEVPPEVQELLRQELARRQPAARPSAQHAPVSEPMPGAEARTAPAPIDKASNEPSTVAPATGRTRRTRGSAAAVAGAEPALEAASVKTESAAPAMAPAASPAPRRRSSTRAAAPSEPAGGSTAPAETAPAAPAHRTRAKAAPVDVVAPAAAVADAPSAPAETAPAAPTRRARAKAVPAEAAAVPEPTPAAAPKPRRRPTRSAGSATEG